MDSPINDLLNNKPTDTYLLRFGERGQGVFAALWSHDSFRNLAEFVTFTSRFNSVMQAVVQEEYSEDDWIGFMFVDSIAPARAKKRLKAFPVRDEDVAHVIQQHYADARIPWLHSGLFKKCSYDNNENPEIHAVGVGGFMTVFVADVL